MSISNLPTDVLTVALTDVLAGKPLDREAAGKAIETVVREREELRKKIGTVDIANDLIREIRE